MNATRNQPAGDFAWIRWIARILGSLAAVFWVLALGSSLIYELTTGIFQISVEGATLGALVAVSALGVALAWRWEKIGGALLTISGVALAVFAWITAGHNRLFAVAISGLPFLIAGLLFLAAWRSESE